MVIKNIYSSMSNELPPFTSLSLDEVDDVLTHTLEKKIKYQDEYKQLVEQYQNHLSTFKYVSNEFRSAIKDKKAAIEFIGAKFFTSEDAISAKVKSTINAHNERSQQLAVLQECQLLLKEAQHILELLHQASQKENNANYHETSLVLKQARSKASSALDVYGDLLVYRNAKLVVDTRIRTLTDKLSTTINQLILSHTKHETSSSIDIEIRIDANKLPSSSLPIVDILHAYIELDVCPSAIIDKLTLPIPLYPMIICRGTSSNSAIIIKINPESSSQMIEPDKAIENISIFANLLGKDLQFPFEITNMILSPMLNTLKAKVLTPFLPAIEENAKFRAWVHSARQLETQLINQHIISAEYANDQGGTINDWDIDCAISDSVGRVFIDRARTILFSYTDLNTDPGSPASFQVHPVLAAKMTELIMQTPKTKDLTITLAKISKEPLLGKPDPLKFPSPLKIPSNVLEFIQQVLMAIPLSTPRTGNRRIANQIVNVIDLYLMYTNTIIHHYQRPSARAMALIHNGVMYVSDLLIRIALVIGPTCTQWPDMGFSSRVPKLIQLSKFVVRHQVNLGKTDVIRLVTPLDRLWGDIIRNQSRIQEVLVSVVMRIKAEADMIKDVLVEPIQYYWLGIIYDAGLHSILNEIYTWTDITATESEELYAILQTFLIPAHHFPTTKSEQKSISSTDSEQATIAGEWVPHYTEFRAITNLLQLPLKDIIEQYRTRQYAMVTADRLQRLIVALFRDSVLRATAINEIASAGVKLGLVLEPASNSRH